MVFVGRFIIPVTFILVLILNTRSIFSIYDDNVNKLKDLELTLNFKMCIRDRGKGLRDICLWTRLAFIQYAG